MWRGSLELCLVAMKSGKTGKGAGTSLRGTPRPKMVRPYPLIQNHIVRYEAGYGSSTSLSVTGEDILNIFGVASGTTNVYFPINAVRVKRVSVWNVSNAASSGGNSYFSSIRLSWESARGSRDEVEDVQLGQNNVAYLTSVPPPKSFASMWYDMDQSGSQYSETVFILTFAPGSVLADVEFEVQLANLNAQAVTVTGATPGRVYCTSLGGGTNGLDPIDYPSLSSLPLLRSVPDKRAFEEKTKIQGYVSMLLPREKKRLDSIRSLMNGSDQPISRSVISERGSG